MMSVDRRDRQQERVDPSTAERSSVKNFVRQYGDLVLDPLRDAQPVKTGKNVGDVVRYSIYLPRRDGRPS